MQSKTVLRELRTFALLVWFEPMKDGFSRQPPPEHLATHEAKILAASYIYPHVRNILEAWSIAEDFANMPEIHKGIRRWANANVPIALEWPEGVKSITGQDRLDRAQDYFQRLLDEENIIGLQRRMWHPYLLRFVYWWRLLEDWRDRGFAMDELIHLREKFADFWENRRGQ